MKISKNDLFFFAFEIAKGLAYLHQQQVVHGDIKPANILLNRARSIVKLCDIGVSRVKQSLLATSTMSPKVGTFMYMSPEIMLHNQRCSCTCDIWALGGTLAEMFTTEDFWKIPSKIKKLPESLKNQM